MWYLLSPQWRASEPWRKFELPLFQVWKQRTCTGSRSLEMAAKQVLLEYARHETGVHHSCDILPWPLCCWATGNVYPSLSQCAVYWQILRINLSSVHVLVGFTELSYHRTNKWSQTWALRLSLHRWQLDWKWTPVWKHEGVLVCCPSGCASCFIEAIEAKKLVAWYCGCIPFSPPPPIYFKASRVWVIHFATSAKSFPLLQVCLVIH